MTKPLQILILSDGKTGHLNQSCGLAEAIGRFSESRYRVREIPRHSLLGSLFRPVSPPAAMPRPDLLIGTGHRVHGALFQLSRRLDVPSVVVMKPTLPCWLFDLCLIPRHDLPPKDPAINVIPTRGAINRVPPPDRRPRFGGLFLIGGPSAAHGWDEKMITGAVPRIVEAGSDRPWRATDSRRTPPGQLAALAAACPVLAIYPHADTGPEWLPQRLAEASEVWVTEDSVSMIYEALSSGARVGLLPVPRLKQKGRVARGIDRLVDEGFLTRYADWDPDTALPPPPETLQEADRCARLVIERFFPDRVAP